MSYLQHPVSDDRPVRVGLIGAGWIGKFHAESVATAFPVPVWRPSPIPPSPRWKPSPAGWECARSARTRQT